MKIKRSLPWPLTLVLIALALGFGGAMAMWAYDLGRSITGFHPGARKAELAALRQRVDELSTERDRYMSTANAAESRINIEHALQKQLVLQAKALETENAKLKEDLAFFESLLPASTGAQGISIRRLQVEAIAPNQLHYRLLVMQGGKGERDFVGNLQLIVNVQQAGKNAMMTFPDGKANDVEKYRLSFKHYQRMEGILILPEGVSMKSVQARILERGQVRAQQSANL